MTIHSPMTLEEFNVLVEQALATLSPEVRAMMDNVAVTVAEYPTRAQAEDVRLGSGYALYGLYQGVPLTRRTTHYGMVPPDRITIFMHPMVDHHRSPEAIRRQVQRTVLHEIGHHFGLGEQRLRELGY